MRGTRPPAKATVLRIPYKAWASGTNAHNPKAKEAAFLGYFGLITIRYSRNWALEAETRPRKAEKERPPQMSPVRYVTLNRPGFAGGVVV